MGVRDSAGDSAQIAPADQAVGGCPAAAKERIAVNVGDKCVRGWAGVLCSRESWSQVEVIRWLPSQDRSGPHSEATQCRNPRADGLRRFPMMSSAASCCSYFFSAGAAGCFNCQDPESQTQVAQARLH